MTSSDSRQPVTTDSDSGITQIERCRHVSNLPADILSESETTTSAWNNTGESESSSSKENIVEAAENRPLSEGVSLEENGIPEEPSAVLYLHKVR